MPFIKEQVKIVNDELLAGPLKEKRFEAGRFELIANDVSRTESDNSISYFPGVINENGEASEVTTNDTYPIIIYTKILGTTYSLNGNNSVGSKNNYMTQVTRCKMVVYGKWGALGIAKEALEGLIAANFPDNIPASKTSSLKIDNMTVALRSSNMVSASVWNEEYRGTPFALDTEDLYFSLNYDIQSNYRKGCFKLCDCLPQ